MKNTLIIFGLILNTLHSFGQHQIQYEKGKLFSENQMGIDKFYFVHQTFADAFYMTNLYKQLTDEEMYSILNNAYYSVTKDERVLVKIAQKKRTECTISIQIYWRYGKTWRHSGSCD